MSPVVPLARRSNTLSSSLGLGEKLFASSDERKFVDKIERGLGIVEAGLLDQMHFADDIADVTSRYLLSAGGKRVRPVLTLLTAQLGDGNNDRVIAAAQAIEITHVASLYHDDVMDEAQMRRGVPSAQAVWGNSVAILTGDLLFARAAKIGAKLGETVLTLQAETFERLCLGQLHETIGPGPDQVDFGVNAASSASLTASSSTPGGPIVALDGAMRIVIGSVYNTWNAFSGGRRSGLKKTNGTPGISSISANFGVSR